MKVCRDTRNLAIGSGIGLMPLNYLYCIGRFSWLLVLYTLSLSARIRIYYDGLVLSTYYVYRA